MKYQKERNLMGKKYLGDVNMRENSTKSCRLKVRKLQNILLQFGVDGWKEGRKRGETIPT